MQTFKTLDLASAFYTEVTKLEIKGHLRDQLLRAASSISLNLAEGNAKASAREKRHFFQTAYASFRECETIFRLSGMEDSNLLAIADRLGASLYRLINSKIKDSPNWA